MSVCVICIEALRTTRSCVRLDCCGTLFHRHCFQRLVLSADGVQLLPCPCCRAPVHPITRTAAMLDVPRWLVAETLDAMILGYLQRERAEMLQLHTMQADFQAEER